MGDRSRDEEEKKATKRRKEEHVTRLTDSQLNRQWLQRNSRFYCHLPPPILPPSLCTYQSIPRPGLSGQVLHTYLPVTNGGLGWAGLVWEGHLPTYLPTNLPSYLPLENSACASSGQVTTNVFFFWKNFWFVAKMAIIHRKMKK